MTQVYRLAIEKGFVYIKMADETAQIGETLEREYGKPLQSQDLHIKYFFLVLGKEIICKSADIIIQLQRLGSWCHLKTEWPGILFGEFPKNSPNETERHREERLNHIRIQLLALHADPKDPKDPSKIPHIIVGRACNYYKAVSKHSLSTTDIENVLAIPSDQHLDYFYLVIRLNSITSNIVMDVPSMLAMCPGDWRAVEPKATWPLTFIGHFPKNPFETEREREWRLNKEVRLPLKEYLGGLLKQQFQGVAKPVIILFTRACKYTNM